MRGNIVVLDVGKTMSKLSLWAPSGEIVDRLMRQNPRVQGPGYLALDAAGIEEWLAQALSALARRGPIEAVVPVAHGAALALVRAGRLQLAPMDYDNPMPAALRASYDAERDSFEETGSPALPNGLNAGAQLHLLQALHPQALRPGTLLLPWPQYWAWRLSGVAASEVTSLGCHSDLWCPGRGEPSTMAQRRGWASMLAPLRRAAECLGTLTPEWAARTGLSTDVRIHCGIHDSNAALVAARAFAEIGGHEATVLSTGTWFVSMRTPATAVDLTRLPERRDCLVNVDVDGRVIPSARFMGGREIETLTGIDARRIDIAPDQPGLVAAVPDALEAGARVLPTFAPGSGPFPHARGRWLHMPAEEARHRAAVSLYAALVADVCLDLIGSRERLLVEGRFAQAQVFVRALAALRPDSRVYVAGAQNDVSFGALRLLYPTLPSPSALQQVAPLDADLGPIRQEWRAEAERMEMAA